MKKFDVLRWLRKLRDEHQQRQRAVSPEQQIEQTKAEAQAFRASRPGRSTSAKQ